MGVSSPSTCSGFCILTAQSRSKRSQEDAPSGTVYFSNDPQFQNVSYFQDFSGCQRQNFLFNNHIVIVFLFSKLLKSILEGKKF